MFPLLFHSLSFSFHPISLFLVPSHCEYTCICNSCGFFFRAADSYFGRYARANTRHRYTPGFFVTPVRAPFVSKFAEDEEDPITPAGTILSNHESNRDEREDWCNFHWEAWNVLPSGILYGYRTHTVSRLPTYRDEIEFPWCAFRYSFRDSCLNQRHRYTTRDS